MFVIGQNCAYIKMNITLHNCFVNSHNVIVLQKEIFVGSIHLDVHLGSMINK